MLLLFVFICFCWAKPKAHFTYPIPESKFPLVGPKGLNRADCRWPKWHRPNNKPRDLAWPPNVWPNSRLQALLWFAQGWLLASISFFLHARFLSFLFTFAWPHQPAHFQSWQPTTSFPLSCKVRSSTYHDSLRLQLSRMRRLPANPHGFSPFTFDCPIFPLEWRTSYQLLHQLLPQLLAAFQLQITSSKALRKSCSDFPGFPLITEAWLPPSSLVQLPVAAGPFGTTSFPS